MSNREGARHQLPYFATAAKGTEGLLRDELRGLSLRPVLGDRGGVHFGGNLSDAFRACMHSRIAMRVLEFRDQATVTDSDQLYDFVNSLSFDDVLDRHLTLAVSATVQSSRMTHSQFVARRVKDAIVDRQRSVGHTRSNVDPKHPDVHIYVHLSKDRATVYVDLAGEALHRRGYRVSGSQAPLKETLASALVQLSRWDRASPLLDPCCGSGTIALEAALLAANWAPGLARSEFGLERHVRVDNALRNTFEAIREEARRAISAERAEIVKGCDIDVTAIAAAQNAAGNLQLPVRFSRQDVLNLMPASDQGTIVTNPPYGVRLEGGQYLATRIGRSLSKFIGHRIVVLTPDPVWLTAVGQPPNLEHTLYNGDIECRALGWQL
jgi:putative N6-adenine-specific DNA methylase